MSLMISAVAKAEKNKLYTDSSFKFLFQISLDEEIYICANNEDVQWNGHNWLGFPLRIGDASEDNTGSDPNLTLEVDNVSRALQSAVENSGGGVGTRVKIFVVNTKNLASQEPEFEEEYVVTSTKADQKYITFILGNEYSARTRRPLDRYFKDFCPFRYKDVRCGYNGSIATCNKTLSDCRTHNNSSRFGGFPGIDQKGVYM